MEAITGITTKIAEYAFAPAGQWLCYSFRYNSNIENLKNRAEELQDARNRVQHSIDAAIRNCEEIEADVNKWLTKVDEHIEKAKKVLEGEEEAKMRCSSGACLSLKLRHQLSQEAKKIMQDIGKLLEKGRFDKISYPPASHGLVTTRYMDYVTLESRMSIVKGLMEALGDANINKIGVWGMAGVGKTTLMREVARQAKEEKLFNEVAIAVVTESPDLRRIQGQIADMLDLKFDHQETEIGRASHLRVRLTKDKKTLVILDDLWKQLDLEAIGIPSEACKVVLTSRNRDVLLCGMGTQKDFGLEILREEEAWSLFEKIAGDSVKHPNVRRIATEVAKKCEGLPIALATVSKALKNKSLGEWKDALLLLRRPAPGHITEMLSTVYSPIELSYNYLECQEVKSLFLLCAQLSDFDHYRDFLKYCYGLGLFHGINTLEEARNRLDRLVRNLKDSSLLIDSPYGSERFCMHDVVRDVATIIASKDHNMFVMRDDGGLNAWPDVDALKRCKAFSIHGGDIHQLPNEIECPELRFFHVFGKYGSLQIPDTFFQGMEKLHVLDLTKIRLSSLPSSLLLLKNLQTLCLDNCELGDISAIGELKNLAILSLLRSDISKLPREIGWLTRLRLLDLSNCSKLEVIPPFVLSSLLKLEELYMGNSFVQWEAEGLNNERKNASLAELKHLSHLITLEIQIPNAQNLPKEVLFEKLERYVLFIGDVWDWTNNGETSRTLKLKLNRSFHTEFGIKMLLKRTEDLHLDELKGVKSVLPELNREGFQQLKHLHIQNNAEIKHVINSRTSVIAFPTLEVFVLKNMISLEEICHGELPLTSFHNLRVVKVKYCQKLRFVFSSSIARGLSLLEELEIRECNNMGAIVVKEESEIEDGDKMILFPRLRTLVLEHLPKLMSFLSAKNSFMSDGGEIISEGNHDFDMPLLHDQVVFPDLKRLEFSSIGLKERWHSPHRARSSCRLTNIQAASRFQNLSILHVKGSSNIRYLLPFSTARLMVQLKHLVISACKDMEEILLTEDLGEEEATNPKGLFPRLETLWIKDLPILERFCTGCNIQFPSLKKQWIDNCPKLLSFIFNPFSSGTTAHKELREMKAEERSPTVMQPLFNEEVAFPSLELLSIKHVDDMKIMWKNQFARDSFCKLQTIEIESCENLMNIFQSDMLTRFQSLESLTVIDCSSLLEVFELQELNFEETHAVTVIPLKKLCLKRLPKMKHVWSKDPQGIFRFQNLQEIFAGGCESLKSFFPTSVARCLEQLKKVEIVDCGMEEIVAGERGGGGGEAIARFVFPQVTDIKLRELPRLKWFYPGAHTSEWPMLKTLRVLRCQKIEIFASGLVSIKEALEEIQLENSIKQPFFVVDEVSFPSLEKLVICHLDNLEIIWHNQVAAGSFCNIQELRVEFCKNLLHVFQSNLLGTFQSLTALHIKDCGSLEAVFDQKGQGGKDAHALTATHLREMYFMRLPKLKNIWNKDCQDMYSFQNLHKIAVEECESLKSFFPASVATSLRQLEDLQIFGCAMEEIVAREERTEAAKSLVFPRLTFLRLENLPELKWFSPGVHTSEWPSLKELKVWGCDQVKIFASKLPSFQVTSQQSQLETSIEQPLFAIEEVAFRSLEELVIGQMDNLEIIWHKQFAIDSFCKLRTITIESCGNLKNIFRSDMLKSFQSLESLTVIDCASLPEVFELEGLNVEETHAVTVIPLKKLYLAHLPIVKHVWSKDPQAIFRFQNLQEIYAKRCESLKSFFPASVARCLEQLEKVEIVDCGVEEIVTEEGGGEAIARFVFPRVTSLDLTRLPRLKWFYPGVHTSEWPMLKVMWVDGCQKIEIFASGLLSFQESQLEISIKQSLFLVNLVSFPSLERLVITHMDNLKIIWHNQVAADSFRNIQELVVRFCENVLHIFHSNMLRRFQSLFALEISDCGSLEAVFEQEGQNSKEGHAITVTHLREMYLVGLPRLKNIWNKGCNGMYSFQNLRKIVAEGCKSLKSFFPASVAMSLIQLEDLHIVRCGMEEIVGREEGAEAAVRLVFPRLTSLKLEVLPKLKCFFGGGHTLEWSSLKELEVWGCDQVKDICFKIRELPRNKSTEPT